MATADTSTATAFDAISSVHDAVHALFLYQKSVHVSERYRLVQQMANYLYLNIYTIITIATNS